MKKEGRVTLECSKILPCGITDRFTVVTSEKSKNDVKIRYKAAGYKVKEIELEEECD